jgi:hypothetical protein
MVYFPQYLSRAVIEHGAPIRGGRVKGMRVVRLFRRVRIPLVVLLVIGYRVDSVFGSRQRTSHAGLVHGGVKAERVSNHVNAYTQCLVKANE